MAEEILVELTKCSNYLWNVPSIAEITPSWKFPSMVEMRLTLNMMLFTAKLHPRWHIKPTFKSAAFRMQV